MISWEYVVTWTTGPTGQWFFLRSFKNVREFLDFVYTPPGDRERGKRSDEIKVVEQFDAFFLPVDSLKQEDELWGMVIALA